MIAVLLAMVGLLGSVAVQQTMLNASRNASENAIALRLATQALEELQTRVTHPGPPVVDQLAGIATGAWGNPQFLDANGRENNPKNTAPDPVYRFSRRVRVADQGVGLPYNISVQVSYALDAPTPKIVQIDVERRKTW
jgi:type II secretory pathway pseudopilin PulG